MIRHRLLFAFDAVAALAAMTKRQQAALFRVLDAVAQFPHAGEVLPKMGKLEPTYVRTFGVWRVVWWVDEPVNEVQILQELRLGR